MLIENQIFHDFLGTYYFPCMMQFGLVTGGLNRHFIVEPGGLRKPRQLRAWPNLKKVDLGLPRPVLHYLKKRVLQTVLFHTVYVFFSGCGAAAERVYDLANVWNIPIIGVPAATVGLQADPSEYNHLTRMSITYPTMKNVIVRFLNKFNYTSPVFFQDTDISFYNTLAKLIQSAMQMNNVNLYQATKFVPFGSQSTTMSQISDMLVRASLTSRGKQNQVFVSNVRKI